MSDLGAEDRVAVCSSVDELAAELGRLDGELEIARRRLYAVENGLEMVNNQAAESAARRAVCDRLSERFRETYSRWQAAARVEDSASAC